MAAAVMYKRTTARSGRAVVTLRTGRAYEGQIEIAGPFVHFSGRRRVGHGEDVSYRRAGDCTWPYARIDSIRWIKDGRPEQDRRWAA
jgi:hypothetical protein